MSRASAFAKALALLLCYFSFEFCQNPYLFTMEVVGILRNSESIMAIVITTRIASVRAIASHTPRMPMPPTIGNTTHKGINRMICLNSTSQVALLALPSDWNSVTAIRKLPCRM